MSCGWKESSDAKHVREMSRGKRDLFKLSAKLLLYNTNTLEMLCLSTVDPSISVVLTRSFTFEMPVKAWLPNTCSTDTWLREQLGGLEEVVGRDVYGFCVE